MNKLFWPVFQLPRIFQAFAAWWAVRVPLRELLLSTFARCRRPWGSSARQSVKVPPVSTQICHGWGSKVIGSVWRLYKWISKLGRLDRRCKNIRFGSTQRPYLTHSMKKIPILSLMVAFLLPLGRIGYFFHRVGKIRPLCRSESNIFAPSVQAT